MVNEDTGNGKLNSAISSLSSLRFEGRWKLPNDTQEVSGALEYSPIEGIELHLNGTFQGRTASDALFHADLIHGVTAEGRSISLADCDLTQAKHAYAGHTTSAYEVKWLIAGAHYECFDQIKTSSVDVRFRYGEECLGIAAFQSKNGGIAFELPDRLHAKMGDYDFVTAHQISECQKGFDGRELTHSVWFKVQGPTDIHIIDWLAGPIRSLQYFLGLMANTSIPVTSMRIPKSHGSPPGLFVDILRSSQPLAVSGPSTLLPVFRLSRFKDDLSARLTGWHSAREKAALGFDFFFRAEPASDTWLPSDFHFLSAVIALESYHRAFRSSRELPIESG